MLAMRLAQFAETEGSPWAGVELDETRVVHLSEAANAAGVQLATTTRKIISEWNWRRKVDLAVEYAATTNEGLRESAALRRLAPITDPQKVVCVGLNYRDHAEESDGDIPDEPVLFSKFPTSIIGASSTIEWNPDLTDQVDYEAELVIVIGTGGRDIPEATARDHVAGYTVGNDVSARDLQFADKQWVRGKSLDSFAPIGPCLVSSDEIDDVEALDIWAEVNGERLQDSNTSNLIFGIDTLVSFCSAAFSLTPGDLIFTGTPAGVGVFRDPPVLLSEGDTVTVGVEDVGVLSNTCAHRR